MAEHLKLISPDAPLPAPGEFIETETARDILGCLHHAKANAGEDFGVVCGAPGIGKTETLRHFVQAFPQTTLHKAVAGEGGIWNLANALSASLGLCQPNGRRLDDSRWHIANRLGSDGMLIIDEAQYLVQRNGRGRDDWQAFEWLRAMAEDAKVALAFVGDLSLREMEAAVAPLWSRAIRTIIIRPRKGDVATIGAQWGIRDGRALDLLSSVARRGGALRKVTQLCRKAQAFAGDRTPTFEHLMAAAECLHLLPKGADDAG